MHWAQPCCLTSLLFFGIPLLYCYTNLNSSIICCLSSGDVYSFLGVALSTSTFVSLCCNSFVDFFGTLVILSAILLSIKSPISWFDWLSHFYNLHLITKVKFVLSSISNSWLFWSANHTSISSYLEWNVLKRYKWLEKFQTVYLEQTHTRLVNLVHTHY